MTNGSSISIAGDSGMNIMQISAGVDISMAVATTGEIYSWGKASDGRTGLSISAEEVTFPTKVKLNSSNGEMLKAVDVECGYMHSLIIALDGTIHMCGGVGTDGSSDGQSMREIADGAEMGELMSFSWHLFRIVIAHYRIFGYIFFSVIISKDAHHKYLTL